MNWLKHLWMNRKAEAASVGLAGLFVYQLSRGQWADAMGTLTGLAMSLGLKLQMPVAAAVESPAAAVVADHARHKRPHK